MLSKQKYLDIFYEETLWKVLLNIFLNKIYYNTMFDKIDPES